MYIQADGSLAAGMLYLRGGPEHRDDHWMMVDKGTGLPVWIDSTLRSARDSLGTAEALGQAFRREVSGWRSDSTARPRMEGGGPQRARQCGADGICVGPLRGGTGLPCRRREMMQQ